MHGGTTAWGRRAEKRAAQRKRANARVVRPCLPATVADPIARPRRSGGARILGLLVSVMAALGAHGVVLGSFFAASSMFGGGRTDKVENRPIELTVIETTEPEPEPEPEPEEPEPSAPEQRKPPKRARPKKVRKRKPPPADPIDLPKDLRSPPPKKKPRRIVGLSLKSTVKGSGGPAFATGNTRMGQTSDRAEDPRQVEDLSKDPNPRRSNRRASRLPIGVGGGTQTKPQFRGRRIVANYPEEYRAQHLEARITVEVTIGPDGRVTKARIVKGSPHKKFELEALTAARKQRWVPAKRGRQPVAYTLSYSYDFFLDD